MRLLGTTPHHRLARSCRCRNVWGLLACAALFALSGLCNQASAQSVAAASPGINFQQLPSPYQLFPRDAQDQAVVPIAGSIDAPGTSATVHLDVYENGALVDSWSQQLDAGVDGDGTFDFQPIISARLSDYRFIVSLISAKPPKVVADVDHVTCGDVFMVQGQSNALAFDVHGQGLANQCASPWVRSYGSASLLPYDVQVDDGWYIADGESANCSGTIGAWALYMAALLVGEFQVPVAILNGAVAGSTIDYHLRNDALPEDTSTNYGRLLFRAHRGGLASRARAMFWYQGESDGDNVALQLWGFQQLLQDWQTDYPALEKVYVFQVRSGCGLPSIELRALQATFEEWYAPFVEAMSTNGLPGHDGCHYWYSGYQQLGEHIARLVGRDLYQAQGETDIEAPRVLSARYQSATRDAILLEFENEADTLSWTAGSEEDFLLKGTSSVVTGTSQGNSLLLTLAGPSSADELDYGGHVGDGPWVTSKNGIGLLSFSEHIAAADGLEDEFTTRGPLLRTLSAPDGNSRGSIQSHRDVALDRQWFRIKARKLAGADMSVTLFVEDAAGSGILLNAGVLKKTGKGRYELGFDSQAGQELPLGLDNVADLAGRHVELRDGAGLVHLEARVPPVNQAPIDEQRLLVGLSDATGTVAVKLNPKNGRQKFELKAAKLDKKSTYDIFIQDPILGSFTYLDTLEPSKSGKLKLIKKSWTGDTFPLGVLSVEQLSSLVIEVRNAEDGSVEIAGQIAQM